MFLLVPAYPGCPGQTAVKWLLLLLLIDESWSRNLEDCQLLKQLPSTGVSAYVWNKGIFILLSDTFL